MPHTHNISSRILELLVEHKGALSQSPGEIAASVKASRHGVDAAITKLIRHKVLSYDRHVRLRFTKAKKIVLAKRIEACCGVLSEPVVLYLMDTSTDPGALLYSGTKLANTATDVAWMHDTMLVMANAAWDRRKHRFPFWFKDAYTYTLKGGVAIDSVEETWLAHRWLMRSLADESLNLIADLIYSCPIGKKGKPLGRVKRNRAIKWVQDNYIKCVSNVLCADSKKEDLWMEWLTQAKKYPDKHRWSTMLVVPKRRAFQKNRRFLKESAEKVVSAAKPSVSKTSTRQDVAVHGGEP